MEDPAQKVRAYYDTFDEWSRLDTPAGQLEFLTTVELLHEVLPPAARVLDLGGGPGRYTIALARAGFRVCLADLSPVQIDTARRRIAADPHAAANVERADVADATDLAACAPGSFDAVVALGPFYHLTRDADRHAAAAEIARVLRPGGRAVVAFVPRLTGLAGLIERAAAHPDQVRPETLDVLATSDVFRNASDHGFQEGYYPDPPKMVSLFESHGLRVESITSTRAFAFGRERELLQVRDRDPALFARFMQAIRSSRDDPGVIALGGHALLIARKPDAPASTGPTTPQ